MAVAGRRAALVFFGELSAIMATWLVYRRGGPPPSRAGSRELPQAASGGAQEVPGDQKWMPEAVSGRAEVILFVKKSGSALCLEACFTGLKPALCLETYFTPLRKTIRGNPP